VSYSIVTKEKNRKKNVSKGRETSGKLMSSKQILQLQEIVQEKQNTDKSLIF